MRKRHKTNIFKELERSILLSPEILNKSRIIAKGNRIRDIKRLISEYGGVASKWTKKSSLPVKIEGEFYEYHWYEHHGIGRFEIKQKKVS